MIKSFRNLVCAGRPWKLVLSIVAACSLAGRAVLSAEPAKGTPGDRSGAKASAAPARQAGETSASAPKHAAPADPGKLTRPNYDLIRRGMTEDEVIALIGRANGSRTFDETLAGKRQHTKVLIWKHVKSNVLINVTVVDGEVIGKNWKRLN